MNLELRVLCDLVEVRVPVKETSVGANCRGSDHQVSGRDGKTLSPKLESKLGSEIEVSAQKLQPMERLEVGFQVTAFRIPCGESADLYPDNPVDGHLIRGNSRRYGVLDIRQAGPPVILDECGAVDDDHESRRSCRRVS